MSAFLADLSVFFNQCLVWLGQVLDTVTGSAPLTVLVLAMPICGFAVSLLRRLIRL